MPLKKILLIDRMQSKLLTEEDLLAFMTLNVNVLFQYFLLALNALANCKSAKLHCIHNVNRSISERCFVVAHSIKIYILNLDHKDLTGTCEVVLNVN